MHWDARRINQRLYIAQCRIARRRSAAGGMQARNDLLN
jgi:hypothetical protein